jgi:hypothetical protein
VIYFIPPDKAAQMGADSRANVKFTLVIAAGCHHFSFYFLYIALANL